MKFAGTVGFWEGDVETSPGIFRPKIVEKPYRGDVYRFSRSFQQSNNNAQNDNIRLNNQISIVSDLYMNQHWDSIRYVIWNGKKFKVNSVDVLNYPRVTLEVGEVYNDVSKCNN